MKAIRSLYIKFMLRFVWKNVWSIPHKLRGDLCCVCKYKNKPECVGAMSCYSGVSKWLKGGK